MPVETNLEREFKFDVPADFEAPDLRPVVGRTERLPEQHLTTTYYDTSDLRLWAQGITLRHRQEVEGDAATTGPGKWTLKLPEGDGGEESSRTELSWKGGPGEVPVEAAGVIAGLVRRARLEPVVALSTDRRRLLLHDPERAWAEIDDDLVTVASGRRQGARFRQIEVELLGREEEGVAAVLRQLRRAGAIPGGGSKFALAAGLDGTAAGSGAETVDGAPAPGVVDVVRAILGADLDRLLAWDFRLRVPDADGDAAGIDVEAVHQARVAMRRLRSDLRTLSAVLDPVWSHHVQSDLKWVGGQLGRLRDEDVLAERIAAHRGDEDEDAVDELLRLLRADRHLGASELGEALASDRYMELLDRLQAAVGTPLLSAGDGENPADASLEDTLTSLVAARWRAVRTEIDDLGRAPTDPALHQVRILAKRLRYAAEATGPYLGKRARRLAAAAKGLQSVLGDLNDAANASRTLRELASHPSVTPAVAFVAGHIAGKAEGEALRLRNKWRKAANELWSGQAGAWLE
jgi:CHAD domain-containing protein